MSAVNTWAFILHWPTFDYKGFGSLKREILSEKCLRTVSFVIASITSPFPIQSSLTLHFLRSFHYVGVDFTSHWWFRDIHSDQPQKMYIFIYTFLNMSDPFASLPDRSSKSFLRSFQSFSNTFRTCDFLYSDNTHSFIQGGAGIDKYLASDGYHKFLLENRIQHRRISLYAP